MGAFRPGLRERQVSRSSGPWLQEETQGCGGVHQELNIWDFSAFQEQAGLFLACVQLWVLFWLLEEKLQFQFIIFLLLPPPRHCQAVSLSIAILCHFPCWPSQILSLIILKSKTDRWAFSLDPPVHCCCSLSIHFSRGNSSSCDAEAPLLPWMGPDRTGCSSRGNPRMGKDKTGARPSP